MELDKYKNRKIILELESKKETASYLKICAFIMSLIRSHSMYASITKTAILIDHDS